MKLLTLAAALLFTSAFVSAQDNMPLSLEEAINMGKSQSMLSKKINAAYESVQHRYNAFMAGLKPQVSLSGVLPSYDSRLDNVVQPDGSYKVQSFRRSNISTNLTVEQNIFWTGGTAFVTSNLSQFTNKQPFFQKQFQTTPFAIGVRQPLTLFNSVKWNFEQEKLRIKQAEKGLVEDNEDLSVRITQTYFDLYVATMEYENARSNEAINDTLFKISQGRFNVGKIAENELLQVELQLMNAKNAVTQSQVRVEVNTKRLRNLLNITAPVTFKLTPVKDAPILAVDKTIAIREARANRSDLIGLSLLENQAKADVKRSQSNRFASGDIFLSYGLNQTATSLSNAYQDPLNAQQVNIGYSIPLFGFGKNKHQEEAARKNLEAVRAEQQYQQKDFDIEVENVVNRFIQLQTGIVIAAKSDTIAQKRYDVAKNRYLLGKISITDLGLAQDAKDKALIDYTRILQEYWVAYYTLRRITLFDFEKEQKISAEVSRK